MENSGAPPIAVARLPPTANDDEDISEKYRSLKRRFQELEEKHKETNSELQRTGERNVRMQEERSELLERILDLEKQRPRNPDGTSTLGNIVANGSRYMPEADSKQPESDAEDSPRRVRRRVEAEEDPQTGSDSDMVGCPISPAEGQSSLKRTRPQPSTAESSLAASAKASASTQPKRRRKTIEGEPAPVRNTRSRAKAQEAMEVDAAPPTLSINTTNSSEPAAQNPTPSVASPPKSTTSTDGNIDPSLIAQSKPSSSAAPQPNGTPSMSTNPYINLFLPKANPNGTPTPTSAHPMAFANPYMFYSPITPITPNTPNYAYGNPYLYMGPHIAYPPTPSSSTQCRPPPPPPAQSEPPGPSVPKPKRTKAHAVTSKSFSIPLVPRDKQGRPMLPLNVGIMTVISLGNVCMREHFHTERYIFPVGYEVTRRYLSTVDPSIEVVYHCTILDGGDGPKFQIVPSDTPEKPVIAGTATGAWSGIVKQANAIRNRQHSNSVSGPDFFGLGQNTIKHLIQELPNADKLKNYVWQHFVEGGPLGGRHASVIPALPEEYDASVPRGPVYHTPLEREKLNATMDGSASPGELPKGLSHYPQHIIAQARLHHPHQQQQLRSQAQMPQPMHASQQQHMHYLHQQQQQQRPSVVSSPGQTPPAGSTPNPEQQQHRQQVAQAHDKATARLTPLPPSEPHSSPPTPPQPTSQAQTSPDLATQQAPSDPAQLPPSQSAEQQQTKAPPATLLASAALMTQSPTPITPNTPAPSIASIMNAYRGAAA